MGHGAHVGHVHGLNAAAFVVHEVGIALQLAVGQVEGAVQEVDFAENEAAFGLVFYFFEFLGVHIFAQEFGHHGFYGGIGGFEAHAFI